MRSRISVPSHRSAVVHFVPRTVAAAYAPVRPEPALGARVQELERAAAHRGRRAVGRVVRLADGKGGRTLERALEERQRGEAPARAGAGLGQLEDRPAERAGLALCFPVPVAAVTWSEPFRASTTAPEGSCSTSVNGTSFVPTSTNTLPLTGVAFTVWPTTGGGGGRTRRRGERLIGAERGAGGVARHDTDVIQGIRHEAASPTPTRRAGCESAGSVCGGVLWS